MAWTHSSTGIPPSLPIYLYIFYSSFTSHAAKGSPPKGFPFQHLIGLSSFPVIWFLWGHQLSILTLNLHLCRRRAYFLTAQNSSKIGFVWMGFKQKKLFIHNQAFFQPKASFVPPTPRTLWSCNINITKATDGEVGMGWQTSTNNSCFLIQGLLWILHLFNTSPQLHQQIKTGFREKSLTLITDLQDDSYTAKIKHIHEALQERSMVLGFREIRLCIFKVLQYEFGLDKKKKVEEKCNL